MKRMITRTATATIALVLSACATANPPAPAAAPAAVAAEAVPVVDPAVWKLADEDTTIYMLGTIHLLPKNHNWKTSTIEQVIEAADQLILEVNAGPEDAAKLQPLIMELAITPGLPPLKERVPEDRHARLDELISKSGVPAQAFDMMETWFAAFTLTQVIMREYGLSPEDGVEAVLRETFKKKGKPIGELETVREQLGFFDSLSEETQREFLASALDDAEEAKKMFGNMLNAWTVGDVDAIEATFIEAQMSEELEAALLTRRNANWTEWLGARLEQPGTILVAVGAGHLAGEGSVVDMLEDKGYTVTRIDD
ncbi:TraB/GumN family protein [Sphingomicrobium lutaoense]|uniref:TraB/GumN family protein n=1 Tax=Sphingomicrobium lutaoense TaxID=515949 RepID=A0A839Z1N8_9SPHN|nr:TraB/GumN family protein [Sphingomicrobium lutaoense]MBB3763967.1 hypothetical protein [Sphingomicrobium lutaoense]